MMRLQPNQRGFTLVEVLVALTIFTVGVLAAAIMLTSSIRYNAAAKLASDGVFKAERQIEELLTGSFTGLGDGKDTDGPHSLSWNVTDQGTHKTIALTVTWMDANGNKSFTLNSIKGNF